MNVTINHRKTNFAPRETVARVVDYRNGRSFDGLGGDEPALQFHLRAKGDSGEHTWNPYLEGA